MRFVGRKGRAFLGGGKSGLHGNTAPDNVRRGRPQGKRHRKQTAFQNLKQRMSGLPASSSAERVRPTKKVRVKGCGKSAPRTWKQGRHGKPRREQNRIGTAQPRGSPRSGMRFRIAVRVGCLRRAATCVPDEWPSRRGARPSRHRTRLTGQLAFFDAVSVTYEKDRSCTR